MVKKFIIISIPILLLIAVIAICLSVSNIGLRQAGGEILLSDEIGGHKSGIILYSPATKKINRITDDYYFNGEISPDRTKLILIQGSKMNVENDYAIYEYSLIEDKLYPVVKCNGKNSSVYKNVRYIPKSNSISYVFQDSLHIYNLITREENDLVELNNDENYAWSNDGSYFLFNKKGSGKIYKYYLTNNRTETLFEGKSPELSYDNRFLAYKSSIHELRIKNIETGEEWDYSTGRVIANYRFSPDSNYIAIVQTVRSLLPTPAKKLKVWNFKNHKLYNMFTKPYYGSVLDWK